MCLLAFIPEGVTPSKKYLLQSACSNPHGFGYAIVADGKLIVGKSMNAEALVEEFLRKRKDFKGPALFHARFATHGESTVANCHPFYVDNDKRTVLGHNGILDIPTPANDPRSDTRIFAEELLPRYGTAALDDRYVFEAIEDWARGSKLVVLTVDPAYSENYYILNEKAGHWHKGVWWSNYGYTQPKPTKYDKYSKYGKWDAGWELDDQTDPEPEDVDYECVNCGELVDPNASMYEYCSSCGTCFECGVDVVYDCLCYDKRF